MRWDGIGRTGVVGVIMAATQQAPGAVIGLRADMDAAADEEMSSVPYASENAGHDSLLRP